ncbi:MAG: alpha/beta fold hydrolase [Gemmatimonadetes bacterium]|nr:alpha/beta fold hydrolase [Gemmatimonadota bacterium]
MAMLSTLMPGAIVERTPRPLRTGPAQVFPCVTADGVELRLTRYQGGVKGPVILAPGFGTSTLAFVIDTVDTNLTEFLYAQGYDVWLLDYRASPALPAAHTQFTLDDIARLDYPAAVARVCEISGAETVQILGHCVASATLLMALLAGLEHVRSAICSQFLAYVVPPVLNELKADARLARLFKAMGERWMSSDYTGSVGDRIVNELMVLYPTQERCSRPVCRRILFMYGEVFKHLQLNLATHDAIPEMFGLGNMSAFEHLTTIIRRGRLVDSHGHDVYLPNVRNVRAPIALLQGDQNHIFLKKGGELTYDWLCRNNGADRYAFHVVPGYKHMDCFIGENACWDVFPVIGAELDRCN